MKKHIKKLLYFSLIAFMSIGINFDAEARLPKYMAQRAAELLIEKCELQLKQGVTKEAFVADLVDFLYLTEKRQNLADWFRPAYTKDIKLSEASDDIQKLFANLDQSSEYINIDRKFVNNRFPCWTGTLTCFMIDRNNLAYQILSHSKYERNKDVYLKYKDGTNTVNITASSTLQKIIHVLFLLELIDTWDEVKKITESEEEAPHDDVLGSNSYIYAPIPNTMYSLESSEDPQGSCMISTINNLLCVLCQNSNKLFFHCNLKENIRDYVNSLSIKKKRDFISGMTNPENLKAFADIVIPDKPINRYQPTVGFFVFTLNNLLIESIKLSDIQIKMLNDNTVPISISDLLTEIFKRITEHQRIVVTFSVWSKKEKFCNDWPRYKLIIEDRNVNKKITVGLGARGAGEHIEITNIENL